MILNLRVVYVSQGGKPHVYPTKNLEKVDTRTPEEVDARMLGRLSVPQSTKRPCNPLFLVKCGVEIGGDLECGGRASWVLHVGAENVNHHFLLGTMQGYHCPWFR